LPLLPGILTTSEAPEIDRGSGGKINKVVFSRPHILWQTWGDFSGLVPKKVRSTVSIPALSRVVKVYSG
jgi:hypothetical protein